MQSLFIDLQYLKRAFLLQHVYLLFVSSYTSFFTINSSTLKIERTSEINMLSIAIGSCNPVKIQAVQSAFQQVNSIKFS